MAGFLTNQSSNNQTEALYIAYFSRGGDGPGVVYWTDQFASLEAGGKSPDTAATLISQSFAVQPEATALYGFLAAPPAHLNPSDPTQISGANAFITQVFQDLFNHGPDAAGLLYWRTAILDVSSPTHVSVGAAVYAIANGAQGADATILADKITAATYFTSQTFANNLGTTVPLDPTFEAAAHAAITPVVDNTTLNQSKATTDHYVLFPNDTVFLTTGLDTVDATHDFIFGTAGGTQQTLTDGDHITGNASQVLTVQVTDSFVAPGVATIDGTGLINLQVAASNNQVSTVNGGLNAQFWGQTTAVGTVQVTPEAQNTITAINNAPTATTYALNAPNNNAALYVGFRSAGAGSFSIDSGVSVLNPGLLDATGATPFANGLANALTSATIATAGTNWDTINLGTNAHTVTLTGSGHDTFSFGPLPTSGGLDIEFSTTTNNQILKFQDGALNTNTGNAVTIHGGTGTGDSVTANGMTVSEALTMTGVESLTTTVVGASGTTFTFNGANVFHLETITVNSSVGTTGGPGDINLTFNNMNVDPMTVNILGPTGHTVFNGTGPAGVVTINYIIPGPGAPAQTWDGLRVTDVQSLTVNFNDAGGFVFAQPLGEIQGDFNLTALTINNLAPSSVDAVSVGNVQNVVNFTVEATAASAVMAVTDFFIPVVLNGNSNAGYANVNVLAPATDAQAFLSGVADNFGFNNIVVTAGGDGSSAAIGDHFFKVVDPDLFTLNGNILSVTVTASGVASFATIDELSAPLGSVSLLTVQASGADSKAFISEATAGVSFGSVSVLANGADATAQINFVDPQSIGTVVVDASASASHAFIGVLGPTTNGIENISVTAEGQSSTSIIGAVLSVGNVESILVQASGADSLATLLFTGTLGNITSLEVDAFGTNSIAFSTAFTANPFGTLETVLLQATGVDSFAGVIVDPFALGTMTVHTTALGNGFPNIVLPPSFLAPLPPIPLPPLFPLGGTESTAAFVLASFQDSVGGTVNIDGAGFFLGVELARGGQTWNANNTGGFEFLVVDPDAGSTAANSILPLKITSASDLNYIMANNGVDTVSAPNETGFSTTAHATGNTFAFFDAGNLHGANPAEFDPAGALFGGAVGAGVAIASGLVTGPTEIINSGFTSGGTNSFALLGPTGTGQLIVGNGDAGSATNFTANLTPAPSLTALLAAAAPFLTGTAGAPPHEYYFGVVGSNGFLAVNASATAAHVTQIVELVGVTSMNFHDIIT